MCCICAWRMFTLICGNLKRCSFSSLLLDRWWVTMLWRRKKKISLSKANCIQRQLGDACQRHRMQLPLLWYSRVRPHSDERQSWWWRQAGGHRNERSPHLPPLNDPRIRRSGASWHVGKMTKAKNRQPGRTLVRGINIVASPTILSKVLPVRKSGMWFLRNVYKFYNILELKVKRG